MADLYPLPMGFPCSAGATIKILISRDGWRFREGSQPLFDNLPAAERLDLRRAFEAQVLLAKATPTKGDT